MISFIQISKSISYLKLLCIAITTPILCTVNVNQRPYGTGNTVYNLDPKGLSNLDTEQYQSLQVKALSGITGNWTVENLTNNDQISIESAMGTTSLNNCIWFKYLLAFFKKKEIETGYNHVKIRMNKITFNIYQYQKFQIKMPIYPSLKEPLVTGYLREYKSMLPKQAVGIVMKYTPYWSKTCELISLDCYYFDMKIYNQNNRDEESKYFIAAPINNIEAAWEEQNNFYQPYTSDISDTILVGIVYGIHQKKTGNVGMFRFISNPLLELYEKSAETNTGIQFSVIVRSKKRDFEEDCTIKDMPGKRAIRLVKRSC